MSLEPGTVTAVLGPNGSGKSTLLKGIVGLPGVRTAGSTFLDGSPLGSMKRGQRARLIAYLPQSPPVPVGLSGLETVLLGLYPYRDPWALDTAADRREAMEALELVGAAHLAGKMVDRISGGEFRLLNLASVLVQKTPVILLDEPTSSLDYGHAYELWSILSGLAAAGKTVLATTHRIGMAGGHITGILLLEDGVPAGFGSTDEILSRSDVLSRIYGTALRTFREGSGKGWVVCPAERE